MDDGILGADITEDRVFVRPQVMASTAKNDMDFFGRVRYLVSSFDSSDVVFSPFARRDGGGADKEKERQDPLIQMLRPCDHEWITGEVARRTR